jgi:dephospho-CoA kinase
MNTLVLIIVGLPGSGKTTAGEFYRKRNIPVIRMGEVTDNLLTKTGKSYTEKNEYGIREDLRKKHGSDVYARLTLPHVIEALKKHTLIVIEGMMSKEEKDYFEIHIPKIKVIFIESLEINRHERLHGRMTRPLTEKEANERDHHEIDKLGKMDLKKEADFCIVNDGTIEEFYEKLKQTL